MSRQINLYDAAFRKKRDWLSSQSLILASLLVILLVTIGAGMARWSVATKVREANTVNAQLQTARAAFAELTRTMSSLKADPALQAEVDVAQRSLKSAQSALGLLRGMTDKPAQPAVAAMMQAFSRASIDGLWLTGLAVSEGGNQLEIRGRMSDQALLPVYLHRLESEPVFQGRRFASLNMKGAEWVPPAVPVAVNGEKLPEKAPERWFVEFTLLTSDAPKGLLEGAAK